MSTKTAKLIFTCYISLSFFSLNTNAADSLSYSGRLVNVNGSPVPGPVTLRAELAYTNAPAVILCTQDIAAVTLTKGVFHVKLDLNCGATPLNQVLAQTPTGESVAIRITDVTNSKVYPFQALHSIPFANLSEQLVQMGATTGQFLKWDGTKWVPGTAGSGNGTVTSVASGTGLTGGPITTTGTLSIANSGVGTTQIADGAVTDDKIAGVAASKITGTIGSTQVLDGSIVNADINAAAAIDYSKLNVPDTTIPYAKLNIADGDIPVAKVNGLSTALSALIEDVITNGVTAKAPSENAVFDALATKMNLTGGTISIGTIDGIPTPVNPSEVTNKSYVDTADNLKLNKAGDTMSGVLTLDSDLKIKGGTNYVTLKGHATSAAYDLILPSSAGTSGYVLQTDGSGNLSWINPSSVASGSGTVTSTSIVDGTIVDADINASAAIAQSKVANLTTDLAGKQTTTLANGSILVGNGSSVATAVAVSGDATLSNTGVLTLANSGATANTYRSVTVDVKGRVTAGTNPTTLADYGITDTLVTGVSVTAPITNTGTASVPLIGMPAGTTLVDGYITATDWTTFNSKQAAITAASTINTGSVTTNLQGGVVVNPYGVAAGNTGEIHLKELVANGSHYTGFKAPDSLAANMIYVLPQTAPTAGQVLSSDVSGNTSWVAIPSAPVTSVFGRTGVVTVSSGDYNASQVTNTAAGSVAATDVQSAINELDTEKQSIASFASDVRAVVLTGLSTATNAAITATDTVLGAFGKLQKQITDLAVSAVGGDLSGTLPNPTVVKIQGTAVSAVAPTTGHFLKYDGTNWLGTMVTVGDLKSTALGNLFPGTGCGANQTLNYSVVGDAFSCVDLITAASTINTGSVTTNLQGGVVVKPYGVAAGNTGEIRLNELLANGSHYTGFKAPDSLAASLIYVLPQTPPTAGQVLSSDVSGNTSWVSFPSSAVTSVFGRTGVVTVSSGDYNASQITNTPAGTLAATDLQTAINELDTEKQSITSLAADVRAVVLTGLSTATNAAITATDTVLSAFGKLQKQITDLAVSAVGGDLSGTLPNPTVAKIQGTAVSAVAPTTGHFLKYDGTNWLGTMVTVGDLKSTALGNLFPGTGCAANQTLYYSVVGDAFSCADIGSLDAAKITTGTIAAARLPASASYWDAATGGINYAGGNVGVGITAPTAKLHVSGGSIVAVPGSGSTQCTDFSTGNIQVSSYVASNTIKIGGLVDGGAYTIVLTGYTATQTITVLGYTDAACSAAVTYGVDFGGSTSAVTPTFSAVGNTQLITFIYSASRGVVYASAGTNFYR